jgi:hypothetical protein
MVLPATGVMASDSDTLKTTTQLEYTGYGHEIEFQLIFITFYFLKIFIY